MNILEQLRFAGTWITNKKNVDITTEACPRRQAQCISAKQLQGDHLNRQYLDKYFWINQIYYVH